MNDTVYALSIVADLAFGVVASMRKNSLIPILVTILVIVIVEKYVK